MARPPRAQTRRGTVERFTCTVTRPTAKETPHKKASAASRRKGCPPNSGRAAFPFFLSICRVLGVRGCVLWHNAVQMASTTWSPCAPLWANQNECSILTIDVANASMPLEHSNKGVTRLPWAQIEVEKDGSGCVSQCASQS